MDVRGRFMAGTSARTGSHHAGMMPLRSTVSEKMVLTAALAVAVTLSLATAAWARPATCLEACASRGALTTVARASHTAASRHVAAVQKAHPRQHHRHGLRANRALGVTTTRPQPLSPPRQRPEHRAALPRVSARERTHSGPRAGYRALAALPGLYSLPTSTPGRLDSDRIPFSEGQPGLDHSGRGPPRAGPFTSLPPSFAGGLPPYLQSTAVRPSIQSGSSDAPRSHGVFRAAPGWLAAASSYRFTPSQEPLQRCSHACRPEGAAVCCLMPSVGGFS